MLGVCRARNMARSATTRRTITQVSDILAQMGGLESMARELGVDKSQAAAGAAALLPAIMGGFKKQASSQPTGLEGLVSMLGGLGGGGLLDEVLAPTPTNVGRGNDGLGRFSAQAHISRRAHGALGAATRGSIVFPPAASRCCTILRMVAQSPPSHTRHPPSASPPPYHLPPAVGRLHARS